MLHCALSIAESASFYEDASVSFPIFSPPIIALMRLVTSNPIFSVTSSINL